MSGWWAAERPALPLWTPVMVGLGVQLYFWAATEPPGWLYGLVLAAPFALWRAAGRWRAAAALAVAALALAAAGFAAAGLRAHLVAAPVLAGSYEAAVEGRIRAITRSQAGRPRLVLDDLVIFGLGPAATPAKAQVTLQRGDDLAGLAPGMRVSILARLGPPGAPVEPGGFDYRRVAWFDALGAIGYARGPPAVLPAAAAPGLADRAALTLSRWRAALSAGLRARLPGEEGAFAAAVTVGDRAGVTPAATEALRGSNLAHLLAISGLHMGLVTALVFGAARLALALIPYTARRWPTKRLAAMIALAAALGYLMISGASIATQRAFVMAAVALVAVILNRPAITLRALAVAALIILVLRPESLAHVGFQMSFAATAAIVAGFEFWRERGWSRRIEGAGIAGRVAAYLAALTGTSLLAGLATAPFSAFHFNQAATYGLFANLAAVPIMGFWVAPAALVAAALAPFGLEGAALQVMGWGIAAIMEVARFVAGLEGAVRLIPAAPPVVLTLALGRSPLRALGLLPVLAGFAVWAGADARPAVLVAPGGALLGALGPEGRALDHPKAAGYVAQQWLRADGDGADQQAAADRPGLARVEGGWAAQLANGWRVVAVVGRRPAPPLLARLCEPRTVLVARAAERAPPGGCVSVTGAALAAAGALAVDPAGDGVRVTTAAAAAGDRLWTRAAPQ